MDAEKLGIGRIITSEQARDAIHVAVAPVVAGENLSPGEHVALENGVAWSVPNSRWVGVVDPYLGLGPRKGERFWLFLYPGSITSLRHDWTHHAFEGPGPDRSQMQASKEWIETFAAQNNISFEKLVAGATGRLEGEVYGESVTNDGDSLHFYGDDSKYGEIPPEFWDHVEVVSGVRVPQAKRASYFSCSC